MDFQDTFIKLRELSKKYHEIDEDPLFTDALDMVEEFAQVFGMTPRYVLEDIN